MAGEATNPSQLANPFSGKQGVGDMFAPFFRVRFVTARQEEGGEFEGGEEVAPNTFITESSEIVFSQGETRTRLSNNNEMSQLRSFATSLEIESKPGGANMATLSLSPPFEDAVRIVDDQIIQWNSVMIAEWGWLNSFNGDRIQSDPHYFVIDKPALQASRTDYEITIRGVDMFGYSAVKREDRRVWQRIVYPTDVQILQVLAAKNKMRLDLTAVPPNSKLRQSKLPPTTEGVVDTIEQNEKDWVFFNRLCSDNNCTFYTIGDKIFILDRNFAKIINASYRLVFFQQLETDRDIPMMAFQTQALPNLFWPSEAKELTCVSNNPDDNKVTVKKTDPAKDPDEEHQGPRTSSGKAEADGQTIFVDRLVQIVPNPAYTETETGKLCQVAHGQQNRDEHGKQPARQASSISNQNAEATIPGTPHLQPLMTVRVVGVGRIFSGPYLVKKAVHRIDSSGYETSLTLFREAATGDTVAGKGERPTTGGNDLPVDEAGNEGVAETPAEEA